MGTKLEQGDYDCLAKLAPNEPFFVLRGQDLSAPYLVDAWVDVNRNKGCPPEKLAEAQRVADAMRSWPNRKHAD